MTKFQPIFIIGNPRSGTSLLRIMLTSHPLISIPPECGFIQWWYHKYKEWTTTDSNSFERVEEYIKDLKSSRKIETWNLNFEDLTRRIFGNVNIKNYSDLSLSVLAQYSFQTGNNSTILGDKNNYYINHLDLLKKLYPKAKFLIIARDGRDVACSYQNLNKITTDSIYIPNLPSDLREIAEEWRKNNMTILSFTEKISRDDFIIVRFEDILLNTVQELEKICSFLGIKFNPRMMTYHELNKTNKIEPDMLIDWKRKTYESPDISRINNYFSKFTKEEILSFQAIAGEMLKRFNYELL